MTNLLHELRIRLNRADVLRLLASLVLAILLWGWVTNSQDPETTKVFSSVPVSRGELPVPLEVVGTITDVSVTVTGPKSVIEDIVLADLKASLDLDGIDAPGEPTVAIEVETPRGVWDTKITPSRMPIRVEAVSTELFVIEPSIIGNVDSTRQVSASIVDLSEITAVGPRSSIDRIVKVIAPIQIESQLRDFTSAVTPLALDEEGKPIPEVQLSPDVVTVNVTIVARGKRVVVLTQLVGEPAQGYEVVDRKSNPGTVLVDGPDESVETLISVTTEPIDISDAAETLTNRVSLTGLPEGVTVIDPADQMVDVVVQVRQIGVLQPLPVQAVQVVGLDPGLAVSISPEDVAVTVVASEEVIGALTTNDLSIQVNVAGLAPGTYELKPVVALPQNVTWVSSDPTTITVTITREEPQTAPASASPSVVS